MNKNFSALILIVIAIGIYFTVTSGILSDAQAVKAVNDQYSSALSDASRLVDTRDKVVAQYNAISQTDRDRLDKMIPSTVDNIRLIIDTNNIAIKNGFSLPDIKAIAAAGPTQSGGTVSAAQAPASGEKLTAASFAPPTLSTVAVSFTAMASYDQFNAFLQDLEADLRIMDITHLSVTAADNGLYTFSVQLQTYWLRQ